jgi:lipoprotein-anchoring transpeptidase ErfK/SrfK
VTPPATDTLSLRLVGAEGHPPLVVRGEGFQIRGALRTFVAGQRIRVRVLRNGRQVAVRSFAVKRGPRRTGVFAWAYKSPGAGKVTIAADHAATAQMVALRARPVYLRVVSGSVHAGQRGETVRLLQTELANIGYAVPHSGEMDSGTERGVVAFRKTSGLSRDTHADRAFFVRLSHGGGRFRVRYPRHGKHVEADLAHQVLVEIEPGGHVHQVFTMSSGKPSTPTVVGDFRVYSKDPGTNAKGMVMSNYFIGGYAIHGYADVPDYPASHGCLRIPIPNAAAVYAWIALGDRVDVYAHHGGSHRVRPNAGP